MAQFENSEPAISQKMAWAYAHPIRARALMILGAGTASPRQIAEEIGEPIGKVSYHVRALRNANLIELVETDSSRGGVQHFYRATLLPILTTEEAESQSPAERGVGSGVVVNLMVSDVATAVEAGTFDSRPERVLIRYHARVDKAGWEQLADLYTQTMYRSMQIHQEAAQRLGESGEEGTPVAMHTLVFEMPEGSTYDADAEVLGTTLELADGSSSPVQDRGGSEGREPDAGDPAA